MTGAQTEEPAGSFCLVDKDKGALKKDPALISALKKWGMHGGLRQTTFRYAGSFHRMDASAFADAFFRDPTVHSHLQVKTTSGWAPLGGTPAQLSCSVVPCTRTRLDLFDKLRAAPEPVLREGTWGLVRCFHDEVDGFPVQDMLRELILHDDSPNAEALSAEERSEFLWRLLCHVALGGAMNQFEDSLEPYRGAVKMVYKDLLSCASKTCVRAHAVKKSAVGELEVASAVYSVDHLVMEGEPALFPAASRNNFCYLVVDPARKLCRVLYHAYGTVW